MSEHGWSNLYRTDFSRQNNWEIRVPPIHRRRPLPERIIQFRKKRFPSQKTAARRRCRQSVKTLGAPVLSTYHTSDQYYKPNLVIIELP